MGGRGDLGLGGDDGLLGLEALQMHRTDGRDHGDRRRAPPAEVGDLTLPVGTHFRHEDVGARSQLLVDGPGQPGPVVERGGARHHRA